uniref:Uncharacterized protein n=1 Tax=Hyalomma excavatum TaxID=257692 RepID=A0A131XMX4_9ACAR
MSICGILYIGSCIYISMYRYMYIYNYIYYTLYRYDCGTNARLTTIEIYVNKWDQTHRKYIYITLCSCVISTNVVLCVSSRFKCLLLFFFRVFSLIFSRRNSMYFRFFLCVKRIKKSVRVRGRGSLKVEGGR